MNVADLDQEIVDSYHSIRDVPEAPGVIIGVKPLMFHWTFHVGINHVGYDDNFCYVTLEGAMKAYYAYDGTEPVGWVRNPKTGRRRDLVTGEEWINW